MLRPFVVGFAQRVNLEPRDHLLHDLEIVILVEKVRRIDL